ncbi:MAG: 2-C-methyl-D-erythritol 4-phosphate cytidylyltransferase [Candidatus Izemoplasmatales bacterium]|nr:2-C-methyl-D-erythritol 4-phosphate cytidylyltransferase [Candidatus Izemoplasmatales bacterium]
MYSAVIVGAGKGTRTHLSFNKIFYEIDGFPLIDFTLRPFREDKNCDEIILVVSPEDETKIKSMFSGPKIQIIQGGPTRQESVHHGISKVKSPFVLIHDGARPAIHRLLIDKCLEEVQIHRAVTPALPVKDTIAMQSEEGFLSSTLPRPNLVRIQTPQAFVTEEIKKAHEKAYASGRVYPDDASLYQGELSKPVRIVLGDEYNIKATTKMDLLVLEEILCTK